MRYANVLCEIVYEIVDERIECQRALKYSLVRVMWLFALLLYPVLSLIIV